VGFAAASAAGTPPEGATPFAAALSAEFANPEIEVGSLLAALQKRLAGSSGVQIAVRAPAGPVWLTGGPSSAPPAPRPSPAPAPPVAAAPPPPSPPRVAPVSVPDEEHMAEADRRRIQGALLRLGYYDGRVDGIFGPDTRAAIRRFQHEIGAEMNGRITPEQAGRLLAGGS
jgi:hypothetical protein